MMLFTTVKADAIILHSLFFILRCLLPPIISVKDVLLRLENGSFSCR